MNTSARILRCLIVGALLVLLSACAAAKSAKPTSSGETKSLLLAEGEIKPEPKPPPAPEAPPVEAPVRAPEEPGPPLSGPAQPEEPPKAKSGPANQGSKMVSLNFEGADLEQVLRVLADLANINFVLGPGVKAQVTMRIDRLPATEAFAILQAILEVNNLVAIRSGALYKIVPASAAPQQPAPLRLGKEEREIGPQDGFFTHIITLEYLSAEEAARVLQPLLAQGKVLAHKETNSLVLSGPAPVIQQVLNTLKVLDTQSKQRDVQQIFVYYVANARAAELANVLTNLFAITARPGERPGVTPTPRPSAAQPPGAPPPPPPRPGVPTPSPTPGAPPTGPRAPEEGKLGAEVRIVADERTNALIIRATAQDYKIIEEAIKQLDIIPKQVLIEVLAAEVTLTDELDFGLEYLFRFGDFRGTQIFGPGAFAPAVPSAFPLQALTTNIPGLILSFVDGDRFRLFLTALATISNLNTLATPHVLTLSNKEAKIQVGQEVPIVTQTQSTITAVATEGQNVFQTLQQKDIGRILTIKPLVNENRQVTLDVQLEITDIISLTTGSIGSPSFSKRTVQASLVVDDGQSLLIGGIISTLKRIDTSAVPFLSKIPILGYLFQATKEHVDKTELFIMLTPHVVAGPEEGRTLTELFRKRLDSLEESMRQFREKWVEGKRRINAPTER